MTDRFECRARSDGAPEREDVLQARGIEAAVNARVGEQGLDLRREVEPAPPFRRAPGASASRSSVAPGRDQEQGRREA